MIEKLVLGGTGIGDLPTYDECSGPSVILLNRVILCVVEHILGVANSVSVPRTGVKKPALSV